MFYMMMIYLVFFLLINAAAASEHGDFSINETLILQGETLISPSGLITLNSESPNGVGHAFYVSSLSFLNSSSKCVSFSTTFVFAIVGQTDYHGIAFVISPSKEMTDASPYQWLGLFNPTNNGDKDNHIVAIEFDTYRSPEFEDINDNHVGIDIYGLKSVKSKPAAYFNGNGEKIDIPLASNKKIQVWVDYDANEAKLDVTLSPFGINKSKVPLLSHDIDLSPPIFMDQMHVGFSSAGSGPLPLAYVLGWSFKLNGKAELDLSTLPSLPDSEPTPTPAPAPDGPKKPKIGMLILLSLTGLVLVSAIFAIIVLCKRSKNAKLGKILEDWELQYGPHRFQYKDLYLATKGFNEKNLLGKGGFGQVYKGVLPSSGIQIAVKKISHGSKQGMKEFIAEIATIGRLRHPNLVRLLGYCRRNGELLLVYEFMPNTSLDKFIFSSEKSAETYVTLNWQQRFKIINQVACGLAYLHEEWVQVVIHRDIKASNVLLDGELNGKLGDFGLARCFNRDQDPHTTDPAGTLGYIAPELARNGKATTSTDVYAFGAFCLEVACGRRPVNLHASTEQIVLVDFALECWKKGELLKTMDTRIVESSDTMVKEMDLVLKVSLLCSHNVAALRPKMPQVVNYLNGNAELPENMDTFLLHAREHCFETYGDIDTARLLNVSERTLRTSGSFAGR